MAVENADYPDQLDPSLPAGTDFKSEGDNHIRLIKGVIQNTLQGFTGRATQAEAENISDPGSSKLFSALRAYQQNTARIATQSIAEGGSDNDRLMTSLRTKQYTDNRVASQGEAEGGSNDAKIMTSLKVKQYVDARRATEAQAEGASDANVLLTPLRGGQLAQKNFNDNYTAKIASQAQMDAGAADNVTVTPLKARVTGDDRYLQLAQTTAFTRSLLDDSDAASFRSTLGLGNAATSSRSTSVSSTSTVSVATSSAVRLAYLSAGQGPTSGTTYLIHRMMDDFVEKTAFDSWTFAASGQILLEGVVTVSVQHRTRLNQSGGSTVRILKNGSQVASWATSSNTYVTRTTNVSVVPGDYIVIEHTGVNPTTEYSFVRYARIYSGTRVGAAA